MEIIEAEDVDFSTVTDVRGDLLLAASGYEYRSACVAERLRKSKHTRRVALGFNDRKTRGSRRRNDRIFKELGFALVLADGDDPSVPRMVLLETLSGITNPKIVVDYTVMTTVWYASLISALGSFEEEASKAEVYFIYQPSLFSPPKPPRPNAHIGPIAEFCSLTLPDKPTALVMGLGYIPLRSAGLIDYVEPKEIYAFIADPGTDERFVREVEKNNKETLARIGKDNVVRYPLDDLRLLEVRLNTLVSALQRDYRVIIAPLGPKPFSLISLLLAQKLRTVDVWRVSSGAKGNVYRRKDVGEPIPLCVRFETRL